MHVRESHGHTVYSTEDECYTHPGSVLTAKATEIKIGGLSLTIRARLHIFECQLLS